MAEAVEQYLESHGPALSTDVVAHLVDHIGLSAAAARKRVSRAGGEIRRLAGVTFPHKARFFYLRQQFGSPWYWERLIDALIGTRSAYGYAIAALRQRGGVVPARQFATVSGAPLKQRKHLSPDTIYLRLSEAGLLTKVIVPGIGECVALVQAEGHYDDTSELMRARMITEGILLMAVEDWLKKLGIASYGKVITRTHDVLPQVGTFTWDLSAPSYLGHMVRQGRDGKPKPGFVACDVHLGEIMTKAGVEPFVRKCVTLRSLRNVGPCMQLLVADRFDGEAFQFLKQHGIIPATPANLFGHEVAEGLSQLTSVLNRAALATAIDPAHFDDLFRKLGKIEGASAQLRGTLFEYLVADIARRTISADVKMNRVFKAADKGEAEADIVAVRGQNSITLIECKGYSPRSKIPDDLFKRWLEHNVPICFHAIKAHPDWKNLDVIFEFWATAPLSDKAEAMFANARNAIKPTRYTIELRLGAEIHSICKQTKDVGLLASFEKHFMKVETPP